MRALIIFLAIPCLGGNPAVTSQPPVVPFEARGGEYVSHGPGYAMLVTPARQLLRVEDWAVSMSAAGANRNVSLEGLDRMPGRATYFMGGHPRSSYELYGRVRWRNVYPGIDAIFHANRERLEYDFEIAAERDLSKIRLAFDGADKLWIGREGDLAIASGPLEIHQPKPVAYQHIGGKRQLVDAAYWIDSRHHVRFRTGPYDHHLPLIIDPQIVFDKSFGGGGQTNAAGFVRDTQGNLYIAGSTNSTDFGAVHAFQSQIGTAPLLSTFNAGQTWSFPSLPPARTVYSIAAAPSAPSTLYAGTSAGIFQSSNGGTTWTQSAGSGLPNSATTVLAVDSGSASTVYAGAAPNLYISTDGAMTWHAATNGITGQAVGSIAVSPTQPGTVFVSAENPPAVFRSADSGQTWSMVSFPAALQGNVEPILFTSSGKMVVGTAGGLFISNDGGNTWTQGANVYPASNQGLAVAPNSNILYLVAPGSGKLEISTDSGQSFGPSSLANLSFPTQIAVDPKNPSTVYAADSNALYRSTDSGQTWAQLSEPFTVFPDTIFVSPLDSRLFIGSSTQSNAFVIKWSPDGSQVLYATYLGGGGNDQATGIAVDPLGDAYITGRVTSSNFPTTNGAILSKLTTSQDIFVSKLSPDGSQLLYSTLLGSNFSNPTAIAVDVNGSAVITGQTQGSFPITPGAFQSTPLNGCTILPPFAGFVTTGSAFVSKLTSNGQGFLFSTLFGGSCATSAINVAIDAGGNSVVIGSTTSPDFPVTSDALQPKPGGGFGYYDGFLSRFDPSGHLAYSTYIGGPGYDTLNGIAFDVPGNIYLTGESGGLAIPPRPGFQPQVNASCFSFGLGPPVFEPMGNGMILKLDPAAQVIQSLTYFGAPGCLNPSSIAVDSNLNVWVSGNQNGGNFTPPTVNPVQFGGSGFVSKFSPDLTQLLFSTYFNFTAGLALDSSGFAYTAGSLPSTNFYSPETPSAYVAKIDPTPPAISIDSIASFVPNTNPPATVAIGPGEVIQLNGRGMGPAALTPGVIQHGFLATNVAGVQVTFDGVAVPLLSVSAEQIELVTPFEIAGKSTTTIQILYNGAQSNGVLVPVDPTAVQIVGVFNADFTPNSQSNPAAPNSNMTLYAAGLGNSNPPSQDGQINGLPLASTPAPIQIGTSSLQSTLQVTYAGAAFGLAAGIYQINFVAPAQTAQGLELATGNNIVASLNVFVSQ